MLFSYDDFRNGQQYVSYYVHSCIPTTVCKYTAAFCRMQHIHNFVVTHFREVNFKDKATYQMHSLTVFLPIITISNESALRMPKNVKK